MTLRNIGIVFSPTLGIPAGVFNLFMAEYDYIFFTDAEGCAAPRSISPDLQDAQQLPPQQPQSETSLSSNSSSDGGLKPRSLSPSNTENSSLRANYLREEASGRTNRNSVQYMECLPNALAGLERKLTITRHESDDEEVNDLALQADDDEEEDHSADEGEQSIAGNLSPTPPSASAPQSPQSFNPTVPTSPRDESFATIESGDSLDGKGRQEHTGQRLSKDDLDAMTKTKRTT
ncbi:10837_t:CDS:1, partial [Paraglomus occultum]